ncbi:MAG TPA: hypothetical protein VFT64_04950 [Rickettsiales bacterium]|nr:hypothetical protein [Rickettsiales bacterium]
MSLRIDDDFKYGGIGAPGKLLFSPADARTLEQAIIDSSHPTLSEYGYSRIDPSFVESPNMETISSLTRLYDYCAANKAVFVDMINKIRSHPDTLTSGDIVVCKKQMRVILYLAGRDADDIQTTLTRREAEIQRAEALVVRKASNDNVVCDLTEYATHNGLTLDTMQQQIGADNTGTAETFGRLVGGDYTLRDIDTLLALSDGTGQEPFQTALRQFVNHSMIPHLDYFLIQAMKSEDLSQVRSEDFPNIARFGQQPMLEAGIATFSAAPDNPALAATVAQATNELDLSFLHDANAGGIRERLARASSMVDTQVTEFEGIFDGTRERIAEILSQTSDAQDAKQTTGSTLDKARKDNTALREKAAAIAWDIETKERSLATKSTIRTQTSRRIATGQILGGIALKFLPPPIGGGGNNSIVAGLVTLANARAQNRIEKAGHDVETTRMGERAAGYRSQIVSESALEKQISQIEQEIDKLLESRDYQEKYGTAQKLESVRKAYLAKDILDVGQRNSRNLERISQQHGIATLEDLIGAFDGRTAQALTHFCLGYADSNDLSIIIATSNAATPGTTDPARLALHEMVEEHVKDSIAEHYSRAAQVDKAYQANVIGIGTDFYDARQMVQRETDDKLAALMGYQQATQPGLIEGEFNVRGANDIRRVFDFWLHRHGDRMISGVVTGTVGTPKRVTAHPPDRQRSYVETVKQSYGLDGGSVPSVSDDFQRVCAYEYLYHQNINSLGQGENLASDNPQALTMYPVINATINEFIRSMNLTSLEEYRAHVGERLDNLIAQTFIDFFSELGHRHAADVDINTSKAELLAAQTKPELFALAFEDHLKLTECDARNNFPLFLEIYARNLEKMLEVTRGDDREALLQQIDDVHALTQGQLKPDVVMPGSPTALQNALNRNHTYANTGWNAGR